MSSTDPMRSPADAEACLAHAWITAQDDLDDPSRMDAVRVAADRLQGEGHPLGELVTLGLAVLDGRALGLEQREPLKRAYADQVTALLPEALGPFAGLVTEPRSFDLRWSLCYLDSARLPLHKANMYSGLLGQRDLDEAGMLELFLAQPGARCLRSLTCQLSRNPDAILSVLARSSAPIETLTLICGWRRVPVAQNDDLLGAAESLPYLHTLIVDREPWPLASGDPAIAWSGDAHSIRTLGRAVTGDVTQARATALARMPELGRNADRYQVGIWASDRSATLTAYLDHVCADAPNPAIQLRTLWRFCAPRPPRTRTPLEQLLSTHGSILDGFPHSLHTSAELRTDPRWPDLRAHAEQLRTYLARTSDGGPPG